MMTFHIIEATQLHGSVDAEQFKDSVHRRYRLVSEAKAVTKSDDLDISSVSDDVFIGPKPSYVHLFFVIMIAIAVYSLILMDFKSNWITTFHFLRCN